MDVLAAIYAMKMHRHREVECIRKLAQEVHEANAKIKPIQRRYQNQLWENRRTEGPTGFKMVRPDYG